MTQLRGARVLVTGASRGIGAKLAVRLAKEGAHVALVARDLAKLEDVAEQVRAEGSEAFTLAADLADLTALESLAERVEDGFGPIDVLVNNAGIEPYVAYEEADPEMVARVVAVNFTAPALLSRAFARRMLGRGKGHLVFMGSTSGLFAAPWATTYGATKAAVMSLSRSLALEFHGRGVTTSVVQPGFVEGTGMFEDWRGGRAVSPPAFVGSTSSERVIETLIRSIRHDVPVVTVNTPPMTPTIALATLFPRLGFAVMRKLVSPFMRRLAHEHP